MMPVCHLISLAVIDCSFCFPGMIGFNCSGNELSASVSVVYFSRFKQVVDVVGLKPNEGHGIQHEARVDYVEQSMVYELCL